LLLLIKLLGSPNEEKWPGYSELPNAGTIKWKNKAQSKVLHVRVCMRGCACVRGRVYERVHERVYERVCGRERMSV
jgi:hypothetical protein